MKGIDIYLLCSLQNTSIGWISLLQGAYKNVGSKVEVLWQSGPSRDGVHSWKSKSGFLSTALMFLKIRVKASFLRLPLGGFFLFCGVFLVFWGFFCYVPSVIIPFSYGSILPKEQTSLTPIYMDYIKRQNKYLNYWG